MRRADDLTPIPFRLRPSCALEIRPAHKAKPFRFRGFPSALQKVSADSYLLQCKYFWNFNIAAQNFSFEFRRFFVVLFENFGSLRLNAKICAEIMSEEKKKFRVGLGVCGGIAAYKAIEVMRLLQKQNCAVRVAMTRHATEFIKPLTF